MQDFVLHRLIRLQFYVKKRKKSQALNHINQENIPLTIGNPQLFEGFQNNQKNQAFKQPKRYEKYFNKALKLQASKKNCQMDVEKPFTSQRNDLKRKPLKMIQNQLRLQNHANLQQRLLSFIEIQDSKFQDKQQAQVIKETDFLDPFDKKRVSDPQEVSIYAKPIYNYLRKHEEKYIAQFGYFENIQKDINSKMRSVLLDWLVDVHYKFKLLPETLFLTVNLIDRYLEKVEINRKRLQLVGVTSMFIASKYEEIYAPEVKDFAYVTDSAYTKQEILDMEGQMLIQLDYNITTTSPLRFLDRYARIAEFTNMQYFFARYFLELALIDYNMMKFTPSNLACSAMYLVQKLTQKNKESCWEELIATKTSYSEKQVRPCARELCFLMQKAQKSSLTAVKRKYAHEKFYKVSSFDIQKQQQQKKQ